MFNPNYFSAKKILNLKSDLFTKEELKKAYIKKALLCHPDKHNSSKESTQEFQELKDAYDYMMGYANQCSENIPLNEFNKEPEEKSSEETDMFLFFTELIKGKYSNIIIDILCGIKTISLKVFEKMNKKQITEIYNFLKKYQHVFFITDDFLNEILDILKIKEKKTELCYKIMPNITDLLEDKVYKLTVEDNLYLIPLWHDEVYYEGINPDEEIVITCSPQLPETMYIDNENNLFVKISISLNNSLLEKETYSFFIGKKKI